MHRIYREYVQHLVYVVFRRIYSTWNIYFFLGDKFSGIGEQPITVYFLKV